MSHKLLHELRRLGIWCMNNVYDTFMLLVIFEAQKLYYCKCMKKWQASYWTFLTLRYTGKKKFIRFCNNMRELFLFRCITAGWERPATRPETIHLINGSGSGMFLHFEEKKKSSLHTKMLWSRLGFLPHGKKMIRLYFITLTRIKGGASIRFTQRFEVAYITVNKHQVTIKASHCGSLSKNRLFRLLEQLTYHMLLDCKIERKKKLREN